MMVVRKRQGIPAVAAVVLYGLLGGAPPALAEAAPASEALREAGDEADRLLAALAEPDREDWEEVEARLVRLWSRSGSDAMDLLLRRGNEAIEAGNHVAAVEHLSALVDHAPDFAEGWNARATAFYLMGEYALAMADIERALALNPRHFGALSGLGVMLEDMGEVALALEAQRAAHAIHPHRPEIARAIERLERRIGGAAL